MNSKIGDTMSHAMKIARFSENYKAEITILKAERDSALASAKKLHIGKIDDFLCATIMGTTFSAEAEHRAMTSFDEALKKLTSKYKVLTGNDDLFMIMAEAIIRAET